MATLTSSIAAVPRPDNAGRTVLVYTSNGVETGTIIRQQDLDRLAVWLHQVDDYCAHFPYNGSIAEDERIERECRENHGYCDRCKDHAGKLLSEFAVIARPEAE